MRAVAATFARFIGLTVFLYAAWGFLVNLPDAFTGVVYDAVWNPWLILSMTLIGLIGSVVFLLSFDGPELWRTRGIRLLGWSGMMFCALLPSQLVVIMAPLTALGLLALLIRPGAVNPTRGRHLTSR